jgi:hypothetical protein
VRTKSWRWGKQRNDHRPPNLQDEATQQEAEEGHWQTAEAKDEENRQKLIRTAEEWNG